MTNRRSSVPSLQRLEDIIQIKTNSEEKTLWEWMCNELEFDHTSQTRMEDLFKAYETYALHQRDVALAKKTFATALKRRLGPDLNVYYKYDSKLKSVVRGIAFKEPNKDKSYPIVTHKELVNV